jgi:predicted MFS family arabinose efflux permease
VTAPALATAGEQPLPAAPRGVLGYWRAYLAIARPRWTRVVLAAVLLEGLLMYGALAFIPSALHLRFGLPLWQAALASAVVGAGGFAYTQLAPWLIKSLGERRLALLGGGLVAIGLLALAFGPSPWVAAVGSGLLGLGFYAFHNTLQVHGTQLSASQRSMGMALFALFLFGGQSLGVALASLVVAQTGYAVTFAGSGLAFAVLAFAFVRALQARTRPLVGAA